MGLHNVTIKLKIENQTIEGTFRGLIQASAVDILLLGNKKSSLLLLLTETDIQSITIRHTDGLSGFGHSESNKSISTMLFNKEKITKEVYYPSNRQEAYSILMAIYAKYRGSKITLDTENFDNISAGYQYSIIEKDGNNVIPFSSIVSTNQVSTNQHIEQNKEIRSQKPKIIKEGTSDFMAKILEGHRYERNYWELGYSGQLAK